MATSKTSSNTLTRQVGQLPVCGCEFPMRMWIATTAENRGRRFWKCANSGRRVSCNLFIWDDELDALQVRMVAVTNSETVLQQPRVHECKCVEVEAKKIEKLKQKLTNERKKMKWLEAILIVMIVFVAFEKFDYLKK